MTFTTQLREELLPGKLPLGLGGVRSERRREGFTIIEGTIEEVNAENTLRFIVDKQLERGRYAVFALGEETTPGHPPYCPITAADGTVLDGNFDGKFDGNFQLQFEVI